MSMKVRIRFEKQLHNGQLGNMVTMIKFLGESTDYLFPLYTQHESFHKELFQIGIVKNACKSMSKEGQYRNLSVMLPEEVSALYTDNELNFVFKTHYLEEFVETKNATEMNLSTSVQHDTEDKNELIKLCNDLKAQLQIREISLADIEKKFILDKFTGKQQNAKEWLVQFEKECDRYKITDENKKVQSLRLFLEEGAKEWYSSSLRKLSLCEWSDWKTSFLLVYADKSWTNVRFAYNYKYINGSLTDYALKKERLLLEIESTMSNISRINLIVIGLPFNIQEKLDKEEINSTDLLLNKIRMYDTGYNKQKREDKIKYNINNIPTTGKSNVEKKFTTVSKLFYEKKPCSMCEALNKPERYHPHHLCRNKQQYIEMKKVNVAEVNQTEIDELLKIELDNQKN